MMTVLETWLGMPERMLIDGKHTQQGIIWRISETSVNLEEMRLMGF